MTKRMVINALAGMALTVSSAYAAELTTVSETMKVAVDLSLAPPQCYYEFNGTTLSWREPAAGDSVYLAVIPRDLVSSSPLSGCTVNALISTTSGKVIGTSITLHETWDKQQPHYGANVSLPDDVTSGDVDVRVEPAKMRRMGREEGDFFTRPVIVEFQKVDFSAVKSSDSTADTSAPAKVEWPEGRRPYATPTPYPGSR